MNAANGPGAANGGRKGHFFEERCPEARSSRRLHKQVRVILSATAGELWLEEAVRRHTTASVAGMCETLPKVLVSIEVLPGGSMRDILPRLTLIQRLGPAPRSLWENWEVKEEGH